MEAICSSYMSSSDPEEDPAQQHAQESNNLKGKDLSFGNLASPDFENGQASKSLQEPCLTSSKEVMSKPLGMSNVVSLNADKISLTNNQTMRNKRSKSLGTYNQEKRGFVSFVEENAMPYISKAKRIKLLCKNTNKEIISEDLRQDDHTLLFKNARTLSPSNYFSYHAPKRRLSQTTAHKGCINRISWNPCYQNHLLSASMDSLLKIWNTESAVVTCIKLVHCHSLAIKDARWCLDGMKILSASYDKTSKITDVNNGTKYTFVEIYII